MSPAEHIDRAIAVVLCFDDSGRIVNGKAVRFMEEFASWVPDVVIWSRPPTAEEAQFAESRLKVKQGTQFIGGFPAERSGVALIHAERLSHRDKGWTPAHDDTHVRGELTRAAVAYCWYALTSLVIGRNCSTPPPSWPFEKAAFKPANPLRLLVKAGALIAAEIDRLARKHPEWLP